MKLPETAAEAKNVTQKCLEHHVFPQCIRARDGKHIPLRRPNQNYAGCINWKGFIFINVQVLCNNTYYFYFLDVAGSVHDSRIFFKLNLNQKLKNKFVPPCNRQIVEGEMKISICILGDSTYPLLPHLTKEYQKGGKDDYLQPWTLF